MGEDLKTDVGSAEERGQATERRQQEIQEATVRVGVVGRRRGESQSHVQQYSSAEHGWSKCRALHALGLQLQTVHTVRRRVTLSTIGSLRVVSQRHRPLPRLKGHVKGL